jgi:hypothetical protein
MYDVRISDSLYEQASQAARAQHLSVDDFIEQVIKKSLRDPEALTLTPEQLRKVRHAQEDVNAGRVLTLDEAKADQAAHRTAWLAANPH